LNENILDVGFVNFSKRERFLFSSYLPVDRIVETVQSFLIDLCETLKKEGCKLIGHIKVLLNAGPSGFFFISVTSFDQIPKLKGEMGNEILEVTLTINAIVYDFNETLLKQLINQKLQTLCKLLKDGNGG